MNKGRNLRDRKVTVNDDDGAAADAALVVGATPASSGVAPASAAPAGSQSRKAKKYPCGKCDEEVTSKSLCCQMCEFWFHSDCVPGMTKEYFDNCRQTQSLIGHTAFLCHLCRRVIGKINGAMKKMEEQVKALGNQVAVLAKENETLAQRVENMEVKTTKVKEGLEGVEKEVMSGMERTKEEVKRDMGKEMKEREERSQNVVLYGIEESKAAEVEERVREEQEKVEEVMSAIGVELREKAEEKFRAGKKIDGGKPRPLIVRIADDENRERVYRDARKLARIPALRSVFVAHDLTWAQREEARKEEKELRELAEKKTEEAKNEGKRGKYLVVGQRGRRRVVWTDRVD